jgi:hypothetical protein
VILLVCTAVGLCALVAGYALGLGGAVSTLIFLTIVFTGAAARWAEPIVAALRR